MTQFRTQNNYGKTLDGFFNEIFKFLKFFKIFKFSMREDVFSFPPVNITEKAASYHIQVSAPGMEKSDFSIKLDGNLLSVSAEKKEKEKEEGEKTIRREFTQKAFKRSFTLDEKIDANNIVARYEHGILMIDLAKKEVTQNGAKEITIL